MSLIPDELCECRHCKRGFKKFSYNQQYCNAICRKEYTVKKQNEEWAKRVIDRSPRNSKKVFGDFFRKKYGISNKYKVCRG